MAREGADTTGETDYMIGRTAGKEAEVAATTPCADAREMRAVVLAGFGGLSKVRVTRKAMPELQGGEVKIRVKAW